MDFAAETLIRIDTADWTGEVVGVFSDLYPAESDADLITFDDDGTLYYLDGQPGGVGFIRIFRQDIDFALDPELIHTSAYYVPSDLTVRDDILYLSGERILRRIDLPTDTYSEVGTMFSPVDYDGALLSGLTWRDACDTADATFTYPEVNFCIADAAVIPDLIVTPGGSFVSEPIGLDLDPMTGEIDPSASEPGTYEITYTTAGACPSSEIFVITNTDEPMVDAYESIVVCEGEVVELTSFTGSPGVIFEWTNDNPAIGLPESGTGNIPAFTAGDIEEPLLANIMVTAVLGECIGDSITFTIQVNKSPEIEFSADVLNDCTPLKVSFTAEVSEPGGSCFWVFGDGLSSEVCDSVIHTYHYAGVFDVSLTYYSLNGCSSTIMDYDLVEVENTPIASFILSSTTISASNSDVYFNNTSLYSSSYQWDFGDGTPVNFEEKPNSHI